MIEVLACMVILACGVLLMAAAGDVMLAYHCKQAPVLTLILALLLTAYGVAGLVYLLLLP